MRTNVVIDDRLMGRALKVGKFHTKRSAIEAGLKLLVQVSGQRRLKELRGRIRWGGDLESMRKD